MQTCVGSDYFILSYFLRVTLTRFLCLEILSVCPFGSYSIWRTSFLLNFVQLDASIYSFATHQSLLDSRCFSGEHCGYRILPPSVKRKLGFAKIKFFENTLHTDRSVTKRKYGGFIDWLKWCECHADEHNAEVSSFKQRTSLTFITQHISAFDSSQDFSACLNRRLLIPEDLQSSTTQFADITWCSGLCEVSAAVKISVPSSQWTRFCSSCTARWSKKTKDPHFSTPALYHSVAFAETAGRTIGPSNSIASNWKTSEVPAAAFGPTSSESGARQPALGANSETNST